MSFVEGLFNRAKKKDNLDYIIIACRLRDWGGVGVVGLDRKSVV